LTEWKKRNKVTVIEGRESEILLLSKNYTINRTISAANQDSRIILDNARAIR